jgi:H+/gluconate symporter-like permease
MGLFQLATNSHIPLEVLHRLIAMAAGGFDTLPHNGAVITLLMVTGLTHCEAYKDIFAITLIKTTAVFFVIGVFTLFGIVVSMALYKRRLQITRIVETTSSKSSS